MGREGQLCPSGGVLRAFLKLLSQPPTQTPPVSCLHSSPSSQATSLGEQLPEPGAFHWGSASSTGFMFQVSGTWHRAAQGPGHRVNIPALSGGTHPPRCPCLDKAMYLGMS